MSVRIKRAASTTTPFPAFPAWLSIRPVGFQPTRAPGGRHERLLMMQDRALADERPAIALPETTASAPPRRERGRGACLCAANQFDRFSPGVMANDNSGGCRWLAWKCFGWSGLMEISSTWRCACSRACTAYFTCISGRSQLQSGPCMGGGTAGPAQQLEFRPHRRAGACCRTPGAMVSGGIINSPSWISPLGNPAIWPRSTFYPQPRHESTRLS